MPLVERTEYLEEVWLPIPEFPNYEISNQGSIYNLRRRKLMSISKTVQGHAKITLTNEWTGQRFTRSVAKLVAEGFVERPRYLCDQVLVKDGNFSNLRSENLAWRPEYFVYRYTKQLKNPQPIHYKNLEVLNTVTGECYNSIVEAGMKEGLLFEDIWKSTYTGDGIYPYGYIFQIIQ